MLCRSRCFSSCARRSGARAPVGLRSGRGVFCSQRYPCERTGRSDEGRRHTSPYRQGEARWHTGGGRGWRAVDELPRSRPGAASNWGVGKAVGQNTWRGHHRYPRKVTMPRACINDKVCATVSRTVVVPGGTLIGQLLSTRNGGDPVGAVGAAEEMWPGARGHRSAKTTQRGRGDTDAGKRTRHAYERGTR